MDRELSQIANSEGTDRLFNSFEFAEPPEWVPMLPKPGEFTHPSYGKVKVTPESNHRFVKNFEGSVYQAQLPIDAEHQTKLSGACGWIQGMRLNADGSADAKVEWTDRGKSLIESDRFKYISPEWYSSWVAPDTGNKHENVLIGAAITTRPFFKESSLRPLVASEGTIITPKEDDMKKGSEGNELSFAEAMDRMTAAEERAQEAEQQVKKFADLLDSATGRIAAMESENLERRMAEISDGWVGDKKNHLIVLKSFAESFGEDSDTFKAYVTQQNAVAAQLTQSGIFDESGSDSSETSESAYDKAKKLAEVKMEKTGVDYGQALSSVFQDNPGLYTEYAQEAQQ